jgi:hypothetical protein
MLTIAVVGVLAWSYSCAQVLQISKRVAIPKPLAVSVNAQGNLFAGDHRGTVRMYDTAGVLVNSYSPQRVAEVTSLGTGQGLRVFCFYRDLQEFTLLDRFLTPLPGYARPVPLNLPDGGFARLATPSPDGQLWVFDDTDFSLKKYNLLTRQITIHVPLELVLDKHDYQFTSIREYQNILFLHDARNGVLLFDNAGNFRKRISQFSSGVVELYRDELFFVQDNRIFFLNLYDEKVRSVSLPDGIKPLYVTVVPDKVFLLTGKELIICSQPL